MNTESMGTGMSGGPGGPGGTKVPIYELAKELGIPNKDLVTKIRALGIEAKNHMSRLEVEDATRVRRAIDKERQENTIQERLSDTVIRRRAKDGSMLRPPPVPVRPPEPIRPVSAAPASSTPAAPTVLVRKRAEGGHPPQLADARKGPPPAAVQEEPLHAEAPAAPVKPREARKEEAPAAPVKVRQQEAEKAPVPAPEKQAPEKQAQPVAKVLPIPVDPAPRVQPAAEQRPAVQEAAPVVVAPAVSEPVKAPPAVEAAAAESVPPVQAEAPMKPARDAVPPLQAEAQPVVQAEERPVQRAEQKLEQKPERHERFEQRTIAPSAPAIPPRGPQVIQKVPGGPQRSAGTVEPRPRGHVEVRAQAPAEATAPGAPQKTFVTAQTRRANDQLGPTGRFIDLAALRPQTQPPPPPAPTPERVVDRTQPARGPRQEVSGERLRQATRQQQQTRPQQKMRMQPGKKAKTTQITTAAEHKRVVKMDETIIINELARQMGLKATDVLKKIWELGMRNVMINSPIDFDTVQLVAGEFDWRVESTAFQETAAFEDKADLAEDLRPRAPVITIMGHVDHGKTSLLDAIRNANVAGGEAGGITQHIGAYKVSGPSGDVVFLDTPGHEAFTEMRARGAQATDIVVLVVAADDGVMPQTLEALNHAKDAKVPIIVAVNKIDKPGAQPDRIRQQLSAYGLQPEEWGGQTIYADVSARTRVGIDRLVEMLALQAEILELKANPDKPGRGVVIEARMDAKRGPVATILVQEGMLRLGDSIVVGEELGKVRAMTDDKGRQVSEAGPSTPVEILGLSGVPRAGETMNAVSDERAAKELVEHRRQRRIEKDRAKAGPVSLDRLMDAMKAGLKELKIILKADVQGSAEALSGSLVKLSTPQVKVTIIQAGVGGITETDVNLAKAGNAIIIGFHVRPAGKASGLAEQEGVDIKLYDIIYEALDDVKKAMAGLLAPVKREKMLGKAEVRQIFTIPKVGTVAGCFLIEGLVRRNAHCRLVRDSVQIYQGKLASLRRFKDDVREVQQGYECGMSIEGYNDLKLGDVIESYDIEEVAATLS